LLTKDMEAVDSH